MHCSTRLLLRLIQQGEQEQVARKPPRRTCVSEGNHPSAPSLLPLFLRHLNPLPVSLSQGIANYHGYGALRVGWKHYLSTLFKTSPFEVTRTKTQRQGGSPGNPYLKDLVFEYKISIDPAARENPSAAPPLSLLPLTSLSSTPVVSFPPAFLGRLLTGRSAPATSLLLATTPWGVFLIFSTLCPCCSCRHTLHGPVRHCRGVASRPSADICRECRAIQAPQGDDGKPKGRGGADPAPPDAVGRQ